MRKFALIAILCLLPLCARATTYYMAQTAGVFSGGTACNSQTAVTPATAAAVITAGDTAYFCGALTASAGGTIFTPSGSGSSGNLITIIFDTGASLQAPYFSTSGAINLGSHPYYLIDGGSNGFIQATLNGSSGGSCPGGTCTSQQITTGINTTGGNVEIRNLLIENLYVHSSVSDAVVNNSQVNCIYFTGSNISIHNNTMHDASWCLYEPEGAGDGNVSIYQNTIYNVDHGWALGPAGHSGGTNGPFSFYQNFVYGYANWDTTSDAYHHDGFHCYTSGTSGAPIHITALNVYDNIFEGPVGADATGHIFIEGGTNSGSTPCADTSSVLNFYNNLAVADQPLNNGLFGIFSGAPNVYNNTLVSTYGTSAGVCYGSNSAVGVEVFKNNLLSGCNQLMSITSGIVSFTTNYNIYANGGSNSFVCGSNFYSPAQFSSWQSCIAGDASSSYNTSAGLSGTYTLNAGSAAISAGTNLTGLGLTGLMVGLAQTTGSSYACGTGCLARPSTGSWDDGSYPYSSASSVGPSLTGGGTWTGAFKVN